MLCKHLSSFCLVLAWIACPVSYAAELPDLIARLEKLDSKNSVSLTVHVKDERSRTEEEGDAKPIEEGDFTIRAEAQAVTVTVAGQIPDTRVFQEFSFLRASTLSHCAPQLIRDLDGLKLLENRADRHEGIPCRRWRLQSEEKQSRFGVNSTTVRNVDLWLDGDGYPLLALFKTQVKGRMLLFKFNSESSRQQRFKRVGGRLILVFDEIKSNVKSKAGAEKRTVTTTVEVQES